MIVLRFVYLVLKVVLAQVSGFCRSSVSMSQRTLEQEATSSGYTDHRDLSCAAFNGCNTPRGGMGVRIRSALVMCDHNLSPEDFISHSLCQHCFRWHAEITVHLNFVPSDHFCIFIDAFGVMSFNVGADWFEKLTLTSFPILPTI